ncbi:MAG: septum formation initiator family protein [Candidatus Gastranaerophilaceae bacterium]|nr:septum formation initiator family protein [Candidatus Gastranaerophilaceae bacterium]
MENEQKYNEQSPDNNPQVNSKIVEKAKNKSKKHKRKIVFYYSFLTFVLLFCIVQVGASVILNTSKTVAYRSKIKTMNKVRDEAEQRNKDLKNDIKLFSKASSLEEIARNNLKMAGNKEVLVIINNTQPTSTGKEKKKKKHSKNND